MDLFPNGIAPYALGGLLIGAGVAVVYLGTGRIAGASSFLDAALSFVSRRGALAAAVADRAWQVTLVAGIVAGALAFTLLTQSDFWTTEVQWWRLLGGGVLVGVGTRLGRGCTSGHGVCGVGSLSRTSMGSVVTFVLVAIGVAQLVQALGVAP